MFYNCEGFLVSVQSKSAVIGRIFFWFPKKTAINYKRRPSRDARSRIFFLFLKVSERKIEEYNTYEPGIIHRIGTKCLFTSSFELSKLGTISDLRLRSWEVPRVRSVIYVSPSPKRDPHRPPSDYLQPLFADRALTSHFNHYFW